MAPRIVPVIMCGGAGTRLWPVSRDSLPKQFVPLFGPDTTFKQVLGRISDQELFARPIVITKADFRFVVAEQLREAGIDADIVLEPTPRDSGPAVAVAALLTAERGPDALTLVLAADHIVLKPAAFRDACQRAAIAAAKGLIVTFGITPTRPSTSYGYIRPGETIDDTAARSVDAFVEKPDEATAADYVTQGYLWNSGNFLFDPAVMLAELRRFEPAIADAATAAVANRTRDLDFTRLAAEPFARAPKKSIDYAVMEHTALAAVMPADLGWSDIGSWSSLWEVLDRDADGNACEGQVVLRNTSNSLVRSDNSVLTAVIGLDDVVVVSTTDAVLVTSRGNSEQVKGLVDELKSRNCRAAVEHRRIYRPWGHYQDVDNAARHRVKRIVVKPGNRLSLQKHFHRSEHWVVVSGTAEVTVDETVRLVHENESIYIPIGGVHRLANPGKIPLELVEVQVGSYLEEDDIVRLDDVYGRA